MIGAISVRVIIERNGIGDSSSNPELRLFVFHFALILLEKDINVFVLVPV